MIALNPLVWSTINKTFHTERLRESDEPVDSGLWRFFLEGIEADDLQKWKIILKHD